MTKTERLLYGEDRKPSVTRYLRTGAISMKFQDGELRYLYVGSKEIIRRIYFGVRDSNWDTVMPELDNVSISETDTDFKITFNAICVNNISKYSWQGEISGDDSGTVRFKVSGEADIDFSSPRIGINILYGSDSLAGQRFILSDSNGQKIESVFPIYVTNELLADHNSFQTLAYTTDDGIEVKASMDQQCIGMEDQRNYGDSSYKAFSSMKYDYPMVKKGVKREQEFILRACSKSSVIQSQGTNLIEIGEIMPNADIPLITEPRTAVASDTEFFTFNHDKEKYSEADLVNLTFNPALHMPDEDTFMENITTITEWVKSIRQFTPTAKLRFDPITFDSPYPRLGIDPRNNAMFGTAWRMRVIKYLAINNATGAAFSPSSGFADDITNDLKSYAGKPILATFSASDHQPVIDALAIQTGDRVLVWFINLTADEQRVYVSGINDTKILKSTYDIKDAKKRITGTSIILRGYEVMKIDSTKTDK